MEINLTLKATWNQLPLLTPALAAVAVALHLLPPEIAAALQFDRGAVGAGESWRLLTAHLTHHDGNHLAWDVAVFFVLGWICERRARGVTASALFLAGISISLAVWWWQPQFATYRGLSGLACTLFALQATTLLQFPARAPRLVGLVALLGLGAKCLFETATATTLFASGTTYDPVPLAHLIGAAAGVLLPVLCAPGGGRAIERESLQFRAELKNYPGHVGTPSHHR